MRIPGRSRLGAAVLVAAGCAGNAEPKVVITAVQPAAAYSGARISLVIQGGPFRPIFDVDTSGGSETTELGAFTAFLAASGGGAATAADSLMWLSPSELAADLPSGIAPGPYDVEVRDPRGALARLPMGFVSLGPDVTPPVVKLDEPRPGTIVMAGAEVPVQFEADDGPGTLDQLAWKVFTADVVLSMSCSHPPNVSRATCRFVFVAPQPTQPGELLNVQVSATDTAAWLGHDQTTLSIGVPPVVTSFEPFAGPAAGTTPFSVHGKNFIVGTQVLVGGVLLEPDGGTVVSDTLIQGTTPAHDPGLVPVTVRSGSASVDAHDSFRFVGQPQVLDVSPSAGPSSGCTPVTIVGKYFDETAMTRIWFGADRQSWSALQCINYKGANRIEGLTPPGAGAVSVFAEDPVGGLGSLPLAYTYLDVDSPDGGPPEPGPATCPCGGGPP
jgi:hypothetical protein